jgi:hypothetical protein
LPRIILIDRTQLEYDKDGRFGSGGHYLVPSLIIRLTVEPVQILRTKPNWVKIEVAYLDGFS